MYDVIFRLTNCSPFSVRNGASTTTDASIKICTYVLLHRKFVSYLHKAFLERGELHYFADFELTYLIHVKSNNFSTACIMILI